METHERAGTVTAVGQHTVTVTFKRSEACGGCAVRNFCHAGNDDETRRKSKLRTPRPTMSANGSR